MLKLRPHHINCLFFYRGMGYSEAFVERMNTIEKELLQDDSKQIELVVGCDVLCECCPHQQENESCKSDDKVIKLDTNTLTTYGLEAHTPYSFQFIKEKIYKDFDADKFERICSACEWYRQGVCSKEYIEKQKQKFSI